MCSFTNTALTVLFKHTQKPEKNRYLTSSLKGI